MEVKNRPCNMTFSSFNCCFSFRAPEIPPPPGSPSWSNPGAGESTTARSKRFIDPRGTSRQPSAPESAAEARNTLGLYRKLNSPTLSLKKLLSSPNAHCFEPATQPELPGFPLKEQQLRWKGKYVLLKNIDAFSSPLFKYLAFTIFSAEFSGIVDKLRMVSIKTTTRTLACVHGSKQRCQNIESSNAT